MRKLTLAAAVAATLPFAAQAAETEFSFNGFIKLDAMASQYSAGDLEKPDFYNPGATPTGADNKVTRFDSGVKTSRFGFKTVTTLDNGEKVTGFIEMDFLGLDAANKVATNGYNPRLRHAYFNYKNWTIGQNWSTFMDLQAIPETMDVIGPSEGMVMVRQPQVRYSNGGFHVALEGAENTSSTGTGGVAPADDSRVPDLVARYNFALGDSVKLSVAALAREIRMNEGTNGAAKDLSSFGGGVSVAGAIKLGQLDNIKFGLNYGHTGRYVGLAPIADAVVETGTNMENTVLAGGYVSLQHFWTEKLRSTVMYSQLHGSYKDNVKAKANTQALVEDSRSARANLVYAPTKELSYGVEYTFAKLNRANDSQGHLNRLHLTAKYAF